MIESNGRFDLLLIRNEDDFAEHSSPREHLVCLPCVCKGKSMSNERFQPLFLEEIKQGDQILSKP